ncbi:unnamed protein product [Phyllotreta striolata]|uniref:Uncharacterized protein n=1 Tax=Phyllotreta striolata TaxID=444603 RepID=A0A9N9XRY9_PHYSR|nr:unnamed protein product [Phyllotreta striolata]
MNNLDANMENYLRKLIDTFGESKIKDWKVEAIITEHVECVKLKSKQQKDKGDEILKELDLEFKKRQQILEQKNPKCKILTQKNAEMKRIKYNIKKLTNDIEIIKRQSRSRADISNRLFYSSCINLAKKWLNRKKNTEGMLQMRKLENEERSLTAELKDLNIKIEQKKRTDEQLTDQPTTSNMFLDTFWSLFSTTETKKTEANKPQCKPNTDIPANKILILDNQIISSGKTAREKPEEMSSTRKPPSQKNFLEIADKRGTNSELKDKINRFNIAMNFNSRKKSTMAVDNDEISKAPAEIPVEPKESDIENNVEIKGQSPPKVTNASKQKEEIMETRITQDLNHLNIASQDLNALKQELNKIAIKSTSKIPSKNAEGKLQEDNSNEKSQLLPEEKNNIQMHVDSNDRSMIKSTKESAAIPMESKIENGTAMEKVATPSTSKMDAKEPRLTEKSVAQFPFSLPFFKTTSENNSFPLKTINLPFFGKTAHSKASNIEHSAKKRKVDVENLAEKISVAEKLPGGKVDDDPLNNSRSSLYNFGSITQFLETGDNS